MQATLRPYATAGIALVGASVIAVSPVTVPSTAVEEVRDAAVELSALTNPVDVFGPIFETALENVRSLGHAIAENPAPILEQILANQLNGIGNLPAAIEAQIGVLPQLPDLLSDAAASELANIAKLGELGQAFIENTLGVITGGALQGQIELAINAAQSGDLGGAISQLGLVPILLVAGEGLGNLLLLQELIPALQQPFADAAQLLPIAAGPLTNVQEAIAAAPLAAVLPALGAISSALLPAVALGDTIDGLVQAVQNGDPEAAFNTIVTQAGVATQAILAGALDPDQGGVLPGLQDLRKAIAAAITTPSFPPAEATTAEVAKAPTKAAQSFTLAAPVNEIAPTPKAGSAPVEETSESTDADTVTTTAGTKQSSTETVPTTNESVKGGNLYVPGSTTTKGGKHRADAGSNFAHGLKDAAEKTIKGLTSLGRGGKSDNSSTSTTTSGSESGSASSGSGSSGSDGGSPSK